MKLAFVAIIQYSQSYTFYCRQHICSLASDYFFGFFVCFQMCVLFNLSPLFYYIKNKLESLQKIIRYDFSMDRMEQ